MKLKKLVVAVLFILAGAGLLLWLVAAGLLGREVGMRVIPFSQLKKPVVQQDFWHKSHLS